jgi:hypothetical protein
LIWIKLPSPHRFSRSKTQIVTYRLGSFPLRSGTCNRMKARALKAAIFAPLAGWWRPGTCGSR